MSVTEYNFPDFYRGDTCQPIDFQITVNGSSLDLTGSLISMMVRKKVSREYSDGLLMGSFDSDTIGGITITNAIGGEFMFNSQLIDIIPDAFDYDIQIMFSDFTVKTYISGDFIVKQDYTNGR